MPLPSSGEITLAQIAAEWNDSQPHSLSEFYAGGSAGVTSGGAPNAPSSGEISFDDFYGAANQVTVTISSSATNQNVSTLFGSNFSSAIPKVLVLSFVISVNKICSNSEPLVLGKITCLSFPCNIVKIKVVSISAFAFIGRYI